VAAKRLTPSGVALLNTRAPTRPPIYIRPQALTSPPRHIADILQMEEANARQLVSRARKHIADGRRTPVSSDEQRRFLEAFIGAAQKGDLAGLEGLFAEDAFSYFGFQPYPRGAAFGAGRLPEEERQNAAFPS